MTRDGKTPPAAAQRCVLRVRRCPRRTAAGTGRGRRWRGARSRRQCWPAAAVTVWWTSGTWPPRRRRRRSPPPSPPSRPPPSCGATRVCGDPDPTKSISHPVDGALTLSRTSVGSARRSDRSFFKINGVWVQRLPAKELFRCKPLRASKLKRLHQITGSEAAGICVVETGPPPSDAFGCAPRAFR